MEKLSAYHEPLSQILCEQHLHIFIERTTAAEFNADALSTLGAFLKPMQSMAIFILRIATAGVTNNLLIGYMVRRRSLAM